MVGATVKNTDKITRVTAFREFDALQFALFHAFLEPDDTRQGNYRFTARYLTQYLHIIHEIKGN